MARQLVYASAPSGFSPGRSGYCTVARSPGLRDRLVRELELASSHEVGEGEAFTFNIHRLGGETYAVITRYGDAGPDYTGRASTIAHHLVFEPSEIASLPPPADIARRFAGWCERWDGPAAALPDDLKPELRGPAATLPAATWKRLAGDAGKAALFCDASGRAKPGRPPATADRDDTLALLAEASLILDDKGWTTPFTTRRREPDSWAVWHTSGAVIPSALPDPGASPRATLARAGAMAASVPLGGNVTRAAGPSRVTRAAGGGSAAAGEGPDRKLLVGLGAGFGVLVVVAALALLLKGGPSDSDKPASPESRRTPEPVRKPESPLVARIRTALDAEDYFAATDLWLELKKESPESAADNVATLLPVIRNRLVPTSLDALLRTITRAKDIPAPAEIARLRKTIATLSDKARAVEASVTGAQSAELTAVSETLSRMEIVARAVPVCTFAESEWTVAEDGESTLVTNASFVEAAAFRAYLAEPHGPLEATLSRFEGFGIGSPATLRASVGAKDLSPGRALIVRDAAGAPAMTLSFDTGGRLNVTRRMPKTGGASALGERRSVALTLADAKSGKSHTLVMLTPGDTPKPLRLRLAALETRDDTVSPPLWLSETLYARLNAVRRPALVPFGYNGDSRSLPSLEAPRSVLEQALRARMAAISETDPRRAKLAAALAGLPANPIDAGAPWAVVIVPPGSATPRTLIEFSAP